MTFTSVQKAARAIFGNTAVLRKRDGIFEVVTMGAEGESVQEATSPTLRGLWNLIRPRSTK